MRVGPSRLTSTALSSGESKATVAAEWMTMSQLASVARSASSRPRPSVPTSPAIVCRGAVISSNPAPPGPARSPGEGVVAEDLPLDALRGGDSAARAHQEHQLAIGHLAEQAFDEGAVPTNPVEPVMAILLFASASAITGGDSSSRPCLTMVVYHLVESEERGVSRVRGRPTRQRILDAALDQFGTRGSRPSPWTTSRPRSA